MQKETVSAYGIISLADKLQELYEPGRDWLPNDARATLKQAYRTALDMMLRQAAVEQIPPAAKAA